MLFALLVAVVKGERGGSGKSWRLGSCGLIDEYGKWQEAIFRAVAAGRFIPLLMS